MGHIENSAQNLHEIVNNVLDLMHIRSGKLRLQYRRVAIAPLLRSIYEILLPLSERKHVTFREDLPEDLGVMEADEGIVRHIVYYLLESSIRATPQSGEVVLKAERSSSHLTIVTYDTALQFPPEAIEKMKDDYPILETLRSEVMKDGKSGFRSYAGMRICIPARSISRVCRNVGRRSASICR